MCRRAVFIAFLFAASPAMAVDLNPLWNFDDPAQSEARLRAALSSASGDDAFILQTQIARTHGLRADFAAAQAILKRLEPQLRTASTEARTRYWLELGRTYSSGAHAPASQTKAVRAMARSAYDMALETARSAQLDALAIDAIHMLAFVDTAPADQLKWGQLALGVALASTQPSAKAWEASLRNNVGYALYELGRYDDALAQFQRAVALRERGGDGEATRVANWMVAWTLRAMYRTDEALAIQLRLEREREAAGVPSACVYEELELLYRSRGDEERASQYAALKGAMAK